jgi:nifR3 family TIM-barrel protein
MVAMTKEIVNTCSLPVTVKTRLGWDENSKYIVEVAERLQDVGIAAISIHGRTRAQMYKGEADWSLIAETKNNPRLNIPVFGNGDIDTPEKTVEYRDRFGIDGIMIGRASIGAPWIFNEIKHFMATGEHLAPPNMAARIAAASMHFEGSLQWKGDRLGIVEMRRHYANYFKGIPDFKKHRLDLVTLDTVEEIRAKLNLIGGLFADHDFNR